MAINAVDRVRQGACWEWSERTWLGGVWAQGGKGADYAGSWEKGEWPGVQHSCNDSWDPPPRSGQRGQEAESTECKREVTEGFLAEKWHDLECFERFFPPVCPTKVSVGYKSRKEQGEWLGGCCTNPGGAPVAEVGRSGLILGWENRANRSCYVV